MDNSFRWQGSEARKAGGFLARLPIVNSVLIWLTGFMHLTEDEMIDAGIHLGNPYDT